MRGELVRRLGEQLRLHKADLARIVQLEAGKIESEALGEVQEMIDICDFAVGLSRQLHGLTIASERPGHRLMEQWHPMGPTAVITAFNFPVAVWSWNAALAIVCGNPVIWKPSELTPLTALATDALFQRAAAGMDVPANLNQVVLGDGAAGAALVAHEGVRHRQRHRLHRDGPQGRPRRGGPLRPQHPRARRQQRRHRRPQRRHGAGRPRRHVRRGRHRRPAVHLPAPPHRAPVAPRRGARSARHRVRQPARGQPAASRARSSARWSRWARSTACRPRSPPPRPTAARSWWVARRELADEAPDAAYVRPAIVAMPAQTAIVATETFAPVLYVLAYDDVRRGHRSCRTTCPRAWPAASSPPTCARPSCSCSAAGSDCGIANVNIGPSGAEIGGAFGGEKTTGGGRESGSDAWKGYMRRATNTVNYSNALPLAQGVSSADPRSRTRRELKTG